MSPFSSLTAKGGKVCVPNQVQVICLWSLSPVFTDTLLRGDGWAGSLRTTFPSLRGEVLPLTGPEEAQAGSQKVASWGTAVFLTKPQGQVQQPLLGGLSSLPPLRGAPRGEFALEL